MAATVALPGSPYLGTSTAPSLYGVPVRAMPTTYSGLREDVLNHVFPEERYWIDFKRQLYPMQSAGQKLKQADRRHVHEELACDMASMAIRGGCLVYGVAEDKKAHTFDPVGMELPKDIRETVTSIAHSRIEPPLMVEPSLLLAEGAPGPHGFMVIHVPESPDAPHMVDGRYYGRSDTGRMILSDDEIERLMVLRHRQFDRLKEQAALTVASDLIQPKQRQVPHLYFTAMPTRSITDMFLSYTRDTEAARQVSQLCVDVHNEQRERRVGGIGDVPGTLVELLQYRRGSRSHTMWLDSRGVEAGKEGGGRSLGVDDSGGVRFISLEAGTLSTGEPPGMLALGNTGRGEWGHGRLPIAYEEKYTWQIHDVLCLMSKLCQAVFYTGAWQLDVQVDRLSGYLSNKNMRSGITAELLRPAVYDAETYMQSTRATMAEITNHPRRVTASLLCRLFRGFGNERCLDQWVSVEE